MVWFNFVSVYGAYKHGCSEIVLFCLFVFVKWVVSSVQRGNKIVDLIVL